MTELTRDNHFVSQGYLKPWSDDGSRIWAYRTLVSNGAVPEWTRRPIRGVGWHRDLYTMGSTDGENDDFEHWIEREYETPALLSIARVLRGDALSREDWAFLARFLAAQDVRTPTSYVEMMERWTREMPDLLDQSLQESVEKLEKSTGSKGPTTTSGEGIEPFKDLFKITITEPAHEEALGSIKAEIVLGRRFWLASQRHLLTSTVKIVQQHKWGIAEAPAGFTWFTTDHPVVRLNYYHDETYDLKGGWGRPGGELFMPLSPRYLLFTHVGQDVPDRFLFSEEHAAKIQRFLAQRASRWVFAHEPIVRVAWIRPRHVDADAFKAEQEEWSTWHERQNTAEASDGSEAA